MVTIRLTQLEAETLLYHLEIDLQEYGVNGSWGDGEYWVDDNYNYTENKNKRTKRGETIIKKISQSLK